MKYEMKYIKQSTKLKILIKFLKRTLPEFINDIFLLLIMHILDVFSIKNNLTIVSAADYTHFDSSINLFQTLEKFESKSNYVFYDLGLKVEQKNEFKKKFKDVIYIDFNFEAYPDFLSQKDQDNKLGWYGWKPLIIKECVQKFDDSNILWLDSGCIITKPLNLVRKVLNTKGIFVASSVGKIFEWTHKTSINTLNLPKKYLKKNNFAGGIFGINPNNFKNLELLNLWVEFAMKKNALFPEGSSRRNHRHDQSILTMLLYINKANRFTTRSLNIFGIKVHNDPNKIYIWPETDIKLTETLKDIEVDYFTNTYKNATYIFFTNLKDLKKIKSKCKKSQKIIYFSDKKIDTKTKTLLNKHIKSGMIYKNFYNYNNSNLIEIINE